MSARWIGALLALYWIQGFPAGIGVHVLPALLREEGVALGWIGLLKLLALPWALKVFWAPWADNHLLGDAPSALRRRLVGFGVLISVLTGALLMTFPLVEAFVFPLLFCGLLLSLNMLSATQDLFTDGLAMRVARRSWHGIVNSIQIVGYKAGMILAASGLLFWIHDHGYVQGALLAQVLVLGPLLLFALLFSGLPEGRTGTAPRRAAPLFGLRDLRSWIAHANSGPWLLLLCLFKLGDALCTPMLKPLLVDAGHDLQVVAGFTLVSSLAGLLGSVLGGLFYWRVGLRWGLLLTGMGYALALIWLAQLADAASTDDILLPLCAEQFFDGASTVVLFAGMMQRCRNDHLATDYTLQLCIYSVVTGVLSLPSGVFASMAGYATLFGAAAMLSIVAACMALRLPPDAEVNPAGHST